MEGWGRGAGFGSEDARQAPLQGTKEISFNSAAGTDVTLRPSAGGGRLDRWRGTALATDCPSNGIFWMGDARSPRPPGIERNIGAPPLCRAQQSFPEVGKVEGRLAWADRWGCFY